MHVVTEVFQRTTKLRYIESRGVDCSLQKRMQRRVQVMTDRLRLGKVRSKAFVNKSRECVGDVGGQLSLILVKYSRAEGPLMMGLEVEFMTDYVRLMRRFQLGDHIQWPREHFLLQSVIGVDLRGRTDQMSAGRSTTCYFATINPHRAAKGCNRSRIE